MKEIRFNKKQLSDLSFSLSREYLEANAVGAYSSSSIVNCHTRKYHGLLTVKQPQLGADNYVLLSSLDEIVKFDGVRHELATHQYPGVVAPSGYQKIDSFSLLKIPTWVYKFGKLVLKKELLLVSDKNQLLIKYSLIQGEEVHLTLNPLTAFRRIHDLSQKRPINKELKKVEGGVEISMDSDFDSLFMHCSKEVTFVRDSMWFNRNQYLLEEDRGYDHEEDLFLCGHFELILKKGESFVFSASTESVIPEELSKVFARELNIKPALLSLEAVLERAADQFISKTSRGMELCAGFHWFGRWGRDTFIALPGLTIARGQTDLCVKIIDTMLKDLEQGLLTNIGVGEVKEYNAVDASLWFFWTLCELAKKTGDKLGIWKKYHVQMTDILNAYKEGTLFNIKMDHDGLINCGAEGVALTWMDAKAYGEPVTPRRGKPVEINALWYNAVSFAFDCAKEANDHKFMLAWNGSAARIKKSFNKAFWDQEKGYLADVVTSSGSDWSMRPNQLFSISLQYNLVDKRKAASILKNVKKKLFTPFGMRTLSMDDAHFKPFYFGDQTNRDRAYHQGIIWPWLIGAYCEANLKLHGKVFLSEIDKIFDSFTSEIKKNGIGSVSELYHGVTSYEAVGTISQAWSVSEIIRINTLKKEYQ